MLQIHAEGRVCRVVIARPESDNAFTSDMTQQLLAAASDAASTADILTISALGRDFTIGRDRNQPKAVKDISYYETFKVLSEVNRAIASFPGLVITASRGRTYGFAVGLLLRADIALVGNDSRFVLDEVQHGFPPTFVMEELVRHLPMKQALDLVVSGREWDAEEALKIGLASRVVVSRDLDTQLNSLVGQLVQRDRDAVLLCKPYMRTMRSLPDETRSSYALDETVKFFESRYAKNAG